MTLNDLKIGTQLRLGLGTILLCVALLGALAWVQAEQLWIQTKGLYEHPLMVHRSIGRMEVDVESMSGHVRDLFLARNDQEIMASLQSIEIEKTDAERQFAMVYDRYLGPRDDVARLQDDLVKWTALRDETVRLLRAGRTSEAEDRIRPGGVSSAQWDVVRRRLQKIDDFARSRSDTFYQAATEQKDALNRQLGVIVAVILLFSLIVAWLLLRAIKAPLAELTAAADQFRQGKMGARSRYLSANEVGMLSASFNAMADATQAEMQFSENAAQLAGVMLREDEVHAFCLELLEGLLHHTGSQVGAVYFLNDAKTAYEHFESIGLGAGGRAAFCATELEGELGAVLATRRIQRITDIPADTRFTFAAVIGDFRPREILTIPVLSDREVTAVISLASVRPYDASSVRLVDGIWSGLTARVNGVLTFRKTKDLAEKLERKNRELDAQKREVVAQADELTEQNTELEMQKRQLDEASRLKSAFISNMSHELRTPLSSVIALSGVLSRRLANTIPAEEHGYLEVIERNGKNLLALINDILGLSRIEAGREDISVSRFTARELASEIVAMIEPQAREKNIALLNQVSGDLPYISSDLAKCRHILQNLVGNAVKFTEQGQVTIAARQRDNEIDVTVTDSGIGIAADELPQVFDEFHQADDSTSRKYGGTGLGLAIAKKYAMMLRGRISAESVPGKGSIFTLRLPLALELPEGAPTPIAERSSVDGATWSRPAPSGHGQRILLVEDSEPAIIQLTDILESEGYRVQVARNGKAALAEVDHALPDAMILDLMMPEVDGFQVLETIRAAERTAHLPVLILTARHVTGEELSFLKGNHIHQLIQKGNINKAGLLAAIARMVASCRDDSAPPPPRPLRPARPGKPVVLVVDDNPDNLRTAKALLGDRYQVIEAEDGRAGFEQARACTPDIILMDIALPVMDGFAVLDEIRKEEALRHIPVIAVTASAMKGNREEILAHGFDGYISKPIDGNVLEAMLREHLGGTGERPHGNHGSGGTNRGHEDTGD